MQDAPERMPETPPANTGILDLRLLAGIGDALGQANQEELLALLLADLVMRPGAIARASADHDWHALRHQAHLLLGSVRCVGAVALTDCLITIEAAARHRKREDERIAALQRHAVDLHAAIVEYRRTA